MPYFIDSLDTFQLRRACGGANATLTESAGQASRMLVVQPLLVLGHAGGVTPHIRRRTDDSERGAGLALHA
jgi:hypothetical protein